MSAPENQAITVTPGAGTITWFLVDTYTAMLTGAQTGRRSRCSKPSFRPAAGHQRLPKEF
jgi:hypothetical protein